MTKLIKTAVLLVIAVALVSAMTSCVQDNREIAESSTDAPKASAAEATTVGSSEGYTDSETKTEQSTDAKETNKTVQTRSEDSGWSDDYK